MLLPVVLLFDLYLSGLINIMKGVFIMNIETNLFIPSSNPAVPGKRLIHISDSEPVELYISTAKSTGGVLYPNLARKIFACADKMERTIEKLGDNPTPEQVHETKVRDIVRGLQGLTKAYGDCYDEEKLEEAMDSLKKFAYNAGQFKDLMVYEEKIQSVCPGGIPEAIKEKLASSGKEAEQEFRDFYREFKKDKLPEALEILRNPSGAGELDPKDIEKADINRLKTAIRGIADKILSVGLSQQDPEEFHTGRKSLRNLVQIINETDDLFSYKKEDIESLKHLFKSCGKSQDLHITRVWLQEHGFDKEAGQIEVLQKEAQEKAMVEGKEFFASGVLESIKNSLQ